MSASADWPVDHRYKGFPPHSDGRPARDIGAAGWQLQADFSTPIAALKESALTHNLDRMRAYCAENGVLHAPHGKTAMSPELITRQLEHGAWGITVATTWQAQVVHSFGVRRIMVANQCLDPVGLRWIAEAMRDEPETDVLVFADSAAAVELMRKILRDVPDAPSLPVLVEIGAQAGRAGARGVESAVDVGHAIAQAPELTLAGVAGFEGAVADRRDSDGLAAVTAFLGEIRQTAEVLAAGGAFPDDRNMVLSAGGSMFFDLVVEELVPFRGCPADVVIRSGCYVTHDHALYQANSPLAGDPPDLLPAMEVWTRVLSIPEDGLAIIDAGRRDISNDAGNPVVLGRWRGDRVEELPGVTLLRFNDQHGFVHVPETGLLSVGDLVALGISHPCTTFDKWRAIPVVNDGYAVVDAVSTYF
ncbi:alanine racemase [Phytoactinopolyspora limicola]|uniref:alanine racemase n=1 Tax=Phytoactinopolyspora limicola TaxID=2715536 RepID=UPI00140BD2F4|nr:alanine racemase [Phytoactinopolyspora limicola]